MTYDAQLMKKIGIDIFSGAGGLSLGGAMAGIKVRYAIEVNPHAAKSFELNHKGAKVITSVFVDTDQFTFRVSRQIGNSSRSSYSHFPYRSRTVRPIR